MRRMRMKKLALLLSLLALGALGLVACGGGDDDQTTAASETKTTRDEPTRDELAAGAKSCGSSGRYEFAVVDGDVECRVARGVIRGMVRNRLPGFWSCAGPDSEVVCVNEAHGLNEIVGDPASETIVAWCCGTDRQDAYIVAGQIAAGRE
jgi:hypothetical protein